MKMNFYSIRDRLVDVYMIPFPAPDHKQARMGVAAKVNSGDTDGICQAPHQFELHQIAEIDTDTGHIEAKREYICDCASLIRTGIREIAGPNFTQAPRPGDGPTDGVNRTPSGTGSETNPNTGIHENPAPTSTQ